MREREIEQKSKRDSGIETEKDSAGEKRGIMMVEGERGGGDREKE